jgi:hypothetical protein
MPLIRVWAENGMSWACGVSGGTSGYRDSARSTIERPSGVSSAVLARYAASASSSSVTPATGMNAAAIRFP